MSLELGRTYELDGKPWKCAHVNPCRAVLVPAWRETTSFLDPRRGVERSFEFTPSRALSVSPRSILKEWPDV